jgi:hypothetical protein
MASGKRLLGRTAALRVRLRRALAGRRGAAQPADPPQAATAPDPHAAPPETPAPLAAEPEPDPDEPPELPPEEVRELREDLRRELDRLASADIKASRSRHEPASPPG